MIQDEFQQARLRLTFWYTLIIICISLVLSGLYFYRTLAVINTQYRAIEGRFSREENGLPLVRQANRLRLLQGEFREARRQIAVQVLVINGLIVLVAAGASYILAGKTMDPIKKSLKQQNRFIADAAHELRTPITALKISQEVYLLEKNMPKRTRALLEENLNDLTSLEQLTERLLKLSRVSESKKVADETHFRAVSLMQVISRAKQYLRGMAQKEQVEIKIIHDISKLQILGDENLLFELFLNLLENSIKYSHSNTEILVSAQSKGSMVEITIQDEGVGIAKHHLPHIFDRFYKADVSRTKKKTVSYGLGLAIVKKIVEAHAGSISAQSQPGIGTTFFILLPAVKPS